MDEAPAKKKKDYEALASAFMRIPRMDVLTARALLNLGIREIHELSGRCPEALFASAHTLNPALPQSVLYAMRLAVYVAETPEPERHLLHPESWKS